MEPSTPLMEFLHAVPALRGLDDAVLRLLVPALRREVYQADEILCHAGEATPQEFYLVYSGAVNVLLPGQGTMVTKVLRHTEVCGHAVFLNAERRHPATLQAAETTEVLVLEAGNFQLLMNYDPPLKRRLEQSLEVTTGYQAPKSRRRRTAIGTLAMPTFVWLHSGEKVYIVARRHAIVLAEKIWQPVSLLVVSWLLSLGWGLYAWQWAVPFMGILASSILCGLFILTGWMDWENDYFVVTNRRIVHLERDLFFSEVREETMISGIRALDFRKPDYVARQLNMGHIVVKTLAEPVQMTYLPEVERLHAIVKKLWDRSQRQAHQRELATIRGYLQPIVHPPAPAGPVVLGGVPTDTPGDLPPLPAAPPPSLFRKLLAAGLGATRGLNTWLSRQFNVSFLKLRYEHGDSVVYRKHWFLLLVRIWIPSGLLLLVWGAMGAFLGGLAPASLPRTTALLPGLVLSLVFGLWWLYQFEDWRNDIYQITLDTIMDIHRKPLGGESRSESPLDKVIHLRFERPTLLAVLFDYGTVKIKVTTGEGELKFEDVADPEAVQDDISRRLKELQDRRAQAEKGKLRSELKEWFGIYHEEVQPAAPGTSPQR